MNENINLCEILKGHEGEAFYSPAFGYLYLKDICNNAIDFEIKSNNGIIQVDSRGIFLEDGELCIFPSKDQRDWNKWFEEQKPEVPKTWSEYINSEYYELNGSYAMQCAPIHKSISALLKIDKLIGVGYGGNVTDEEWRDYNIKKWYFMPNTHYSPDEGNSMWDIVYAQGYNYKRTFAFHTSEQAEEFLSYPENVQLLKDYFMI